MLFDHRRHQSISPVAPRFQRRVRFAIVGCGANGVAVFNQLITAIARTPVPWIFEVDIFEPVHPAGGGLAYR